MSELPLIILTAGEPAGIGPDIILQLATKELPCRLLVFADVDLLQARAEQLQLPVTIKLNQSLAQLGQHIPGTLNLRHIALAKPSQCGKLDPANARYVLETLTQAIKLCEQQTTAAIVTAPINKAVINQAGIPFTGHTEFFAQQTNSPRPVMLLTNDNMRVALATTHIPLARVAQSINQYDLASTIRIINNDLQRYFAINKANILVCGLNPHAGEQGHLGQEEQQVIIPVIEKMKGEGINVSGPYAADTVFTDQYLQEADVILAMYHDQGLPVIKAQSFGQIVNITLGLPLIRTSVDHGTALPIAGSGKACSSSLEAAVNTALKMISSHA